MTINVPRNPGRSGRRTMLFSIVTIVAFFLLLEGLLSLSGVRPVLVDKDPYVGFSNLIPLYVEQQDGSQLVYKTAKNKLGFFNMQTFPASKDPDSYRIFCMGGSTTYGQPYDYRTAFCGWLSAFLQATEPSRDWQVINAGGISYASYRVTALMEELALYQPDLFIIYSGHNEFLEERTYREIIELPALMTRANALLAHTRVYTLLKKAVDWVRPTPQELKEEVDERLAHTIGPKDYHRDDKLQSQIIDHYRFNLQRMKAIADAAGSRILYIVPSRNLRHQHPFKSEQAAGLTGEQLVAWQAAYQQGKNLLDRGSPGEALQFLDRAVALDQRHAELQFQRGTALFDLGRYTEARAAFERAADEDIAPLRILTSMQIAIREVLAEVAAPLIDFDQLLRADMLERAGHDITGREWFLDHVHPTIEGHRELALAIYQVLLGLGLITPTVDLDQELVSRISDSILGAITPEDERTALHDLSQVLGWAGQQDEAHSILLRLMEKYGEDESSLFRLGRSAERLGKPQEAIRFYQRAVDIAPQSNEARVFLAKMLREQGQIDEAIIHFTASTEIAPTYKYSFYSLAELLAARGNIRGSMEVYRRLLTRYPNDKLATLNLGILLLDNGDLPGASEQFSKLCLDRIILADACVGLAQIAGIQGDLQQSADLYNRLIVENHGNAMIHNNLAIVLREQGKLDEAIDHFRQAVQMDSGFAEARQNLATALQEKQRGPR